MNDRPRRTGVWTGLALGGGQLAIMSTNFVFGLAMAYAGGLEAVGSVAPAMLTFQLACGVTQRVLAEASLLLAASEENAAGRRVCGWAVANALIGGTGGLLLAVATSVLVPGGDPVLGIVFAAGIPFAIALDIGRTAGVASRAARPAATETLAWGVAQAATFVTFAALRSPLGVCAGWTAVNVVFFAGASLWPYRRPLFTGAGSWLRAQRGILGPALVDGILTGLTPLVAVQLSAFVTSVATIGAIRLLQQVFSPLSFISVSLRRFLIYRRRADRLPSRADNLRDGLLATGLMAVGVLLLTGTVIAAREVLPALAVIPVGLGLAFAGVEKVAQGFSYGASLSAFVRGEFRELLLARYVFVALTVGLAPVGAYRYGVAGYLAASAATVTVYSIIVLAHRPSAPARHRLPAGGGSGGGFRSSPRPPVDAQPATRPPGPPAPP